MSGIVASLALAVTEHTSDGAKSHGLTVPSDALGLVFGVVWRPDRPIADRIASIQFGGVALSLVASSYTLDANASLAIYELLDISGRANDNLTFTVGNANGDLGSLQICAAFLETSAPELERIDDGQGGLNGNGTATAALSLGSSICMGLGFHFASIGGAFALSNFTPAGAQTELTEGAASGTGRALGLSYEDDLTGSDSLAVVTTGQSVACNTGMFGIGYAETAPIQEIEQAPGAEAGIPDGFAITAGPPIIRVLQAPGAEAGIPSGFSVTALGPAYALLNVPGQDRPQLLSALRANGDPAEEGDVYTHHLGRPPTLEAPAGGPGGGLTVAEEDGSPEVEDVTRLEFDGAVVSEPSAGVALVTISPAAALRVQDESATEVEDPTDTIIVPDGTAIAHGDGSVTLRELPTGVVGARVYRNTTQTIGAASTAISYSTVEKDTDGFWSGGNPTRLTIPAHLTGSRPYLISSYANANVGSSFVLHFLRKNGSGALPAINDFAAANQARDVMTWVEWLSPGDYVEVMLFVNAGSTATGDNSTRNNQHTVQIALLGSGNVAGLPSARALRTSGNVTLNSTTWANVDTGLDLTIPAQVGDVLGVSLSAAWGGEAVNAGLDAATLVSGSPVNYISGGAGGASHFGVQGWIGHDTDPVRAVGTLIQYPVVSGDISGGNVTLRLRYRTGTASNKTLVANSNQPLQWSVVNLKGGAATETRPWLVEVNPLLGVHVGSNGTWGIVRHTDAGTGPYDQAGYANTPANTDYLEWDVVVSPGTWTIVLHARRSTNTAIATVSVDGTSVGTIDTYAAAPDHLRGTIAGLVLTPGKHRIKVATPTKNGSSSDYALTLRGLALVRTA